jgi:hypothetical protein
VFATIGGCLFFPFSFLQNQHRVRLIMRVDLRADWVSVPVSVPGSIPVPSPYASHHLHQTQTNAVRLFG